MPAESCDPLLNAAWSCCAQDSGSVADPGGLDLIKDGWITATVPGTAASALRAAGRWDFHRPEDLDGQDWWYRTSFTASSRSAEESFFLCFDGLATLAEVWLNGERILTADNMFRSYRVEVGDRLRDGNSLVIVFRSLTADVKTRRARSRWKTNLINSQQLRWRRTSLLGRIPGWSPPVPPVGPWRPVRLERGPVLLRDVQRTSTLDGKWGLVSFSGRLDTSSPVAKAILHVGGKQAALSLKIENGQTLLSGEIRIENPQLWWPHTHGEPCLHDCKLIIESVGSSQEWGLGPIGFRSIEAREEPGFGVQVNGELVYCRGACWTAQDIFTLHGSAEQLRRDLTLARDAGMNMVRIGGTMTYESDPFYALCDELGIMVWQDFMFANMDYPVEDADFANNIKTEAQQQLDRLAQHPCVVVYCGSSEIEQQASMLGVPRELWRNRWFGELLPGLCAARHPGTIYVPSSPSGGDLPFHTNSGVTHYYGIGAYLRSLRELRQADVKFTSECLGFANLPEPEVIDEIMGTLSPVAHHPRWKERVPRDSGAGWDFEDVRDHYMRELFNVDPALLRSFDMPRYLELGRLAAGEMMAKTFSEWRSGHSHNAGALVWFFKDLWAATGWGIIDHRGIPKAAYYQLKRTWQTRQLTITDEGLNGLHLHLINETSGEEPGFLEVQLLREPATVTASSEIEVILKPRSTQTRSVDEILGSFRDANHAYRFGPRSHDVVIATWFNAERQVISEAFYLIRARDPEALPISKEMLQAEAKDLGDGHHSVTLRSERFLHGVRLSAKGYLPDDNYFFLPPHRMKTVVFKPSASGQGRFSACAEALNAAGELLVESSQSAS